MQAAQEKYFLQNNTYTANVSTLGLLANSENGKYLISITLTDAQTYTAYARPTAYRQQHGVLALTAHSR